MKKIQKIFLTVNLFVLTTTSTFAVTFPSIIPGDFVDNFTRLTRLIVPIITLTFLAVFFWGGFTMMTAGEDGEKIKKGFEILKNAIIGLIVIFLAAGVAQLIGNIFGVRNMFL